MMGDERLEYYEKLENELLRIWPGLRDRIPMKYRYPIGSLIGHAEYGLALEVIVDGLMERKQSISQKEFQEILRLGTTMGYPMDTWHELSELVDKG